ncbi:hypothetical protein BDV23DRAFT_169982 [Aspergillus alliaceus]|uniref:Major facilitator superfamily domain-containing protein n=1 Tax=Petromyces alliaceus TaxID=209559 RepID=A0A5N7CI08_PETAA|nr:hypothetical protein BDV23DRAFT_169982 [Aspergillus alliaceus]
MVIFEGGILISGLVRSSVVFIDGQHCCTVAVSHSLHKKATYLGFISISRYLAIAIAPIIGIVLTTSPLWRQCFYINPPHGYRSGRKFRELDLLGFFFFFFAPVVLWRLLTLQWGGETYNWDNARAIVLLVLSPVGFTILSILAVSLFSLSLSACRAIVQYYASDSVWFQTARGMSPLQSGINTLPLVIAILIFSALTGRFISWWGPYTPVMIPSSLFVVGGGPRTLWIPSLVLLGIGSGSGVPTPFIAPQTVLDMHDLYAGMALMAFSQDLETVIHLGATRSEGNVPAQDLPGVTLSYNAALQYTFYLAVALAGSMMFTAVLVERNPVKSNSRPS